MITDEERNRLAALYNALPNGEPEIMTKDNVVYVNNAVLESIRGEHQQQMEALLQKLHRLEGNDTSSTDTIAEQELDRIELPKGTLIKFNGMPFTLAQDTIVLGRSSNYQMALDMFANPRIKSIA